MFLQHEKHQQFIFYLYIPILVSRKFFNNSQIKGIYPITGPYLYLQLNVFKFHIYFLSNHIKLKEKIPLNQRIWFLVKKMGIFILIIFIPIKKLWQNVLIKVHECLKSQHQKFLKEIVGFLLILLYSHF